jgi:hypothetical protein
MAAPPRTAPPSEDRDLAQDLAKSFGSLVASYRECYSLSTEEAHARARGDEKCVEHLKSVPPNELHWCDLDTLEQHQPGLGTKRWEEVKDAACGELRNGYRAARVLEAWQGHCWDRARFLAIRSELLAGEQPRSLLEIMLIDQLAQWQTLLWQAMENVALFTALTGTKAPRRDSNVPELPRVCAAEALENAMKDAERLHRLYLRTLKALQNQRRIPAVHVGVARQVNVGMQQVNMSS